MNVYVRRARSALAAGRPDEASVHAWNAVATLRDHADREELLRIAAELDDDLLLRELQDRGEPRPSSEPASEPEKSPSKLVFLAPALILLVMVGVALTQPLIGKPELDESKISGRSEAHPLLSTLTEGVWLVPVERVERVDLQRLADELTTRYGIPVGVQRAQVTLTPSTVDENADDLVADGMLALLARAYRVEGNATVIGVTDYDMYSSGNKSPFTLRSARHYAIVSTAQLGASLLDRLHGHDRHERTRKLIARDIALLHLRLPMVEDPNSLRRTTMSSVEDIDKLEERF